MNIFLVKTTARFARILALELALLPKLPSLGKKK